MKIKLGVKVTGRVKASIASHVVTSVGRFCIDKSNNNELSEAMFRWSDVSLPTLDANNESNHRPWESDFRKSRWFTRG